MENDLPEVADLTPRGGPRLSPIDKNSAGKRSSLGNQDEVHEFMAYLGPSNDQNCCGPSPRSNQIKQMQN